MKSFFDSLTGTITAIILINIIGLIIIFSLIPDEKPFKVKPNSILHVNLDKPIVERKSKNPFQGFDFSDGKGLSLEEILDNIEKAKADTNIKGIYLESGFPGAGAATLEEIRNALIDFKSEGKFIISYGEIYSQKAYYLASVADHIFLNPQGIIEHKGLSAQLMFFKGLLDKLEIQAQIFRHGKFKSAIEPFMLDKMSQANREQVETYIGSIWGHIVKGISATRGISVESLNALADNMEIQDAGACIKYKFCDDTLYLDQVQDFLKEKSGLKEKDNLRLVPMGKYTKVPKSKKEKTTKDKIAVVYAVGSIESGEGDDETIGSDRIAKAIRDARKDSTIKAIVLRVNSPGGSALASDVMWREVVLARKTKPVIVSMGDVAASGGYYISCGADRIFAQPNTITGSIGVFGMLPNLEKMFKNKLGITFDTANTNKHSDLGNLSRPVSESEGKVIQNGVESIYKTFIGRVANGRGMSPDAVDSIGQGRVWSGVDALKIGLVDELGGLKDAIKYAAGKVNLENYRLVTLPKQKEPFEEILKELSGEAEARTYQRIQKELGLSLDVMQSLSKIMKMKGVQARLPFEIYIN